MFHWLQETGEQTRLHAGCSKNLTAYGRCILSKATSNFYDFKLPHLQPATIAIIHNTRVTTMTHAPPTLTWSLDSTASTTISVAKDVIRAATSDNVQALALMACEKFGATLAMCPETNKKMEDLIIKVSGPVFVRFIGAKIGYSANDCAAQLSRSLAGVQFLGLAVASVLRRSSHPLYTILGKSHTLLGKAQSISELRFGSV